MANILLLEPDKILGSNYKKALVMAGHDVVWHSGSQAAINSVDKNIPDIIIVEPQIRRNNGIEFIYELRSYTDWQHIPVIILSLVPENVLGLSLILAAQLKIVDYLYKPQTSLEKLSRTVEDALHVTIGS